MKRLPLAERRAHLVDAALQIAGRSGLDAVTVRAVAREAGVSLGTVHYCFGSKAELLREMGHALVAVAVDPVLQATRAGSDFRTVVHAAAEGLMAGLHRMAAQRLLSFELSTAGARSAAMAETARVHIAQVYDTTLKVITTLSEQTGVRYRIEPALLARVVAAFVDGIELRWLVERDDAATLAAFHELADVLVSYTEPDDGGAARPSAVVAAPSTASE